MRPRISIVIPVHNHSALTDQCLSALREQKLDATIIVVDDASSDDTTDVLERHGEMITVVRNTENLGFAGSVNRGAAAADEGDDLVFLNNDTVPHEGWLDALVRRANQSPRAGIIGALLLYPDGGIQHAGVVFARHKMPYHIYRGLPPTHPPAREARQFQVVTGACMWVRRAAWNVLGGFDTAYVNSAEDVDLCLRAREAGWEVWYEPGCVVTHHESATRGLGSNPDTNMNEILFAQRWRDRVVADDLDTYIADGMIEVGYEDWNRVRLRVSPAVGEAVAAGAPETESMLTEAIRRWSDAVVAREDLARRARRSLRPAVAFDATGAMRAEETAGHWSTVGETITMPSMRFLAQKVAPLRLDVRMAHPRRVNVLYEGYSESDFYGGHQAMLQLAGRLAAEGETVRVVAVDNPGVPSREEWARICAQLGEPALARVEYADCSDRAQVLEVNPHDRWVVTNWWTMHVAHEACRTLEGQVPLWLQQEWEEILYPGGAYAAMARAAYQLDHSALVSTDILMDFFEAESRGVRARPGREATVFWNPLTTIDRATVARRGHERRVLVYARPANRNASEVALAGVDLAVARRWLPGDWQVSAVGAVDGGRTRMPLSDGREMAVLPRVTPMRYRAMLQSHDVGVALQDSPHPGLVSFDMAAAGMLAITSTYGPVKTAERLAGMSPNVTGVELTPENVAAALRDAVERAGDLRARREGAEFIWGGAGGVVRTDGAPSA